MPRGWLIVVPVKHLDIAKSRLQAWCVEHRSALALAMAKDTISAAMASLCVADVMVVTCDPRVQRQAHRLGAHVAPESSSPGLNESLQRCLRRIEPSQRTAVIVADLPALRPDALSGALRNARRHDTAFVRDAGGNGTTMLATLTPPKMVPGFGPDSALRHHLRGAVEISADHSLTHDVDTAEDLTRAGLLGLGIETRLVVANHDSFRDGCTSDVACPRADMRSRSHQSMGTAGNLA